MATNNSVDTFFVDLAVRADALQTDVGKFVKDLERQLGQELGKTTDQVEKRFISMGGVVGRSVQGMVTTLAQTKNPIAALTSGLMSFNAGVQAAAQGGATWATSISGILGPLAALVTVLAVVAGGFQKVIGFMQQTGEQGQRLAAQVQTLNTGLEVIAKNAGVNVDMVREKVSTLQGTGITTQESITSLMKFLSQDLPIDNIEKLARAGQDMAVAFGQNSTETFQRFVYAITTGNAEVLHMVGIQKTAATMMEAYAASVDKTVAQLTQLERRQAIVNGIMTEAQNYTGLYEKSLESLGKRIGSLPRYIEEGTLAFGQTLIPILETSVAATEKFWKAFQKLFVETEKKEIGGKLKDVPIQLEDGTQKLTEFGEQIKAAAEYVTGLLKPPLDWIIEHLPAMAQEGSKIANIFSVMIAPAVQTVTTLVQMLLDIVVSAMEGVIATYNAITGSNVELEDAFTALKQVAQIVVISIVMGLSAVNSGVLGLNQLLRGEATSAWGDWKNASLLAAKEVYDAMEGVKEQVKEVVSLQQQYEEETGKRAYETTYEPGKKFDVTDPSTYSPTEGPPAQVVDTGQTSGFKEWLKERRDQAAADTMFGTGVDKDDPEAARRAQMMEKAGMAFADAIDGANDAVSKAQQRFSGEGGTLDKFDESVIKQTTKLSESLAKGIEKMKEQYDKAKVKLAESFAEQLVDLDEQTNEAREDENERYQEQQLRSTEDFQLQMKRMNEDYGRTLADLVQSRDARGTLRAMRDFAVNKKNAVEDFENNRKREEEDHRKRQDEIGRRQQEIREKMQEAYDERLEDLAEAMKEQQDEMEESYRDQLEELVDNAAERRQELIDSHKEQMEDLDDANQERLTAMVEHWADLGVVDEQGARDILEGLDEYYGEKGKIETLINDFITRGERNKAIKITLEEGGNANPPPEIEPTCPSGMRWSEARRMCLPDNDPIFMATGGLVTASQPTNILMGDAGPETALFLPQNSKMGLSQAMSFLSGGSGGVSSSSALDITLRISADGTITPAFEDAILDRLADIVLEALPGARLEKRR